MSFRETKLALLAVDLSGYARASAKLDALAIAALLDDWYRRAAAVVTARGGRVVKFMGDALLATFPEERCVDAVDAALELERKLGETRVHRELGLGLGANVHLALVAEGDLGPDDDARYDVLGSGVNHVFMMGGGAGIRISEPVYRRLPNDRRGRWNKHRPPTTYRLA